MDRSAIGHFVGGVALSLVFVATAPLARATAPAPATPQQPQSNQAPSFHQSMDDAMRAMDLAMTHASLTHNPDHDFAVLMIPHHQGAVDMARAELQFGRDPVLRRLAQEIIVTQQQELEVMRAQVERLTPHTRGGNR